MIEGGDSYEICCFEKENVSTFRYIFSNKTKTVHQIQIKRLGQTYFVHLTFPLIHQQQADKISFEATNDFISFMCTFFL